LWFGVFGGQLGSWGAFSCLAGRLSRPENLQIVGKAAKYLTNNQPILNTNQPVLVMRVFTNQRPGRDEDIQPSMSKYVILKPKCGVIKEN
jgi:hypothetical protein